MNLRTIQETKIKVTGTSPAKHKTLLPLKTNLVVSLKSFNEPRSRVADMAAIAFEEFAVAFSHLLYLERTGSFLHGSAGNHIAVIHMGFGQPEGYPVRFGDVSIGRICAGFIN